VPQRLEPAAAGDALGCWCNRFPPDVIVLAVRWYLRFGVSYRDLEEPLPPLILVNQSTEDLATTQLRKGRRTCWVTTHRRYGRAQAEAAVLAADINRWSRQSWRMVPTHRSATALALGARIGVQMIWPPVEPQTSSNALVNFVSRSRIRNLRSPRSRRRLRACEHRTVGRFAPGSWGLAAQPGQLVTEHQDLQVLGGVAAGQQHEQLDGAAQGQVGEVRRHPADLRAGQRRGHTTAPRMLRPASSQALTELAHPTRLFEAGCGNRAAVTVYRARRAAARS
jgi:hypothetical protein